MAACFIPSLTPVLRLYIFEKYPFRYETDILQLFKEDMSCQKI